MKATARMIFEDTVTMKDKKVVTVISDSDDMEQTASNPDRALAAFKTTLTAHFISAVDDAYAKFKEKKLDVVTKYNEALDKAEEAQAQKDAIEKAAAEAKKTAEKIAAAKLKEKPEAEKKSEAKPEMK